jgi:hypothetical protein
VVAEADMVAAYKAAAVAALDMVGLEENERYFGERVSWRDRKMMRTNQRMEILVQNQTRYEL